MNVQHMSLRWVRGLGKGSLSLLFLFLISAEGLYVMINSFEEAGIFVGYDVGYESSLRISHI